MTTTTYLADLTRDDYRLGRATFGDDATATLGYLRNLCANADTDPATLDIAPYLASPTQLLVRRGAVNQRFFAGLLSGEEQATTRSKDTLETFKRLQASSETTIKAYSDNLKRRLRDDYTRSVTQLGQSQDAMRARLSEYQNRYQAYLAVSKIEGDSTVAVTNLKALADEMQHPFWTQCDENDDGSFDLLTQEITITIPVQRTQEFYKWNLGRFVVNLKTGNRDIKVRQQWAAPDATSDIEKRSGYSERTGAYLWQTFHPFLSRGSNNPRRLCVGGEAMRYEEMFDQGALGGMLAITRQVLSHYDLDTAPHISPWDEINAFKQKLALERRNNPLTTEGHVQSEWRLTHHVTQARNSSLSL